MPIEIRIFPFGVEIIASYNVAFNNGSEYDVSQTAPRDHHHVLARFFLVSIGSDDETASRGSILGVPGDVSGKGKILYDGEDELVFRIVLLITFDVQCRWGVNPL